MDSQIIASAVICGVGGVWILISLLFFIKRRYLSLIRLRYFFRVLISTISGFLLLLLAGVVIWAPSLSGGITLCLGTLFSSFHLRTYVLRTFLLLLKIGKNQKINTQMSRESFRSSLEGLLPFESVYDLTKRDSSCNCSSVLFFITFPQYLNTKLRVKIFTILFYLVSLLLDLLLILLVLGLRFNWILTPYPILLDWYLHAFFIVLYGFLLLVLICQPDSRDSFGVFDELVCCFLIFLITDIVYIATLYAPLDILSPPVFNRNFILIIQVLLTFFFSICIPLIRSLTVDTFEDAIPEFDLSGRPQITLKDILDSDVRAKEFQIFLAKEFSAENLFFYRMVEKFQKPNPKITPEMRLVWAKKIFSTFLAEGATTQVNVLQSTTEEISENINNSNVSLSLFDTAQRQIYELMETDSLLRFVQAAYKGLGAQGEFLNPQAKSEISRIVT